MVVLATKCYVDGDAQKRSLDSLESMVRDDVGELDVETDVGVRDDGFPTVTLEGPDETAARNLLRERWGEITPHFEPDETYVGTLLSWDDDGLVLDAGTEIRVSADELDLGPGSPEQLRTRFGLVQHIPLTFVYGDTPQLASETQDQLYEWTRGTGRVNVNSATRAEVRATVNRAGHAQDIVTVERLGLLEQSIVCRENTDPPGLLASIGEYVPAELLCVVP
ncbi:DUF2110 family protein [Halovenus rubra]|uniref:DUF2110 family protein n=2 Tax=Halovenus rubra TaxID=869890 RepID=A0ABD5XB00_9EURY|nr:DUF2110 family protein [Halovenus rubra]